VSVPLADDERLDDAPLLDGIGQLAEGVGRELLPGLKRTRVDALEGCLVHPLARIRGG
jgi:hypothetical protein